MSFFERLRTVLGAVHPRLEDLPLSQRMLDGEITRSEYIALLTQLLTLHDRLEREIERHGDTLTCYHPRMARAPVLRRDLRRLGARRAPPLEAGTRVLVEWFADWSRETPWRLAGALYIFEGSRLGSAVLVHPLGHALGTGTGPGQGIDYHLAATRDRLKEWLDFKARLQRRVHSRDREDAVLHGALATIEGLYEIYAAVGGELMTRAAS